MKIIILLLLPVIVHSQPGRKQVLEGNQLYLEEKYDAAGNKYQDALLEAPTSPLVLFNVGNTHYQKKDFENALKSYQEALETDDVLLQSQVYYNIGNTLYQTQKLQESIAAYQQALKLNPDDEDAKFNLEFVRNKIKENAQQEQQEQNQQQDQQKTEPSEFAKQLKAQADALVGQQLYAQASNIMKQGLQQDPSVGAYQDYMKRLEDIVGID